MSMFGLPVYLFQTGVVDMGDLEFIETKVLAGDYFQVSGAINNINDTIEFVVPNGKTALLIEAKLSMSTNPSKGDTPLGSVSETIDQVVADLLIDGTVKDKATVGLSLSGQFRGSNNPGGPGTGQNKGGVNRFNVLGLSLVGDNVKKIEIKNVLDNGSAFATMSGYLV